MSIDYESVLYNLNASYNAGSKRRKFLILDKWCRDLYQFGIHICELEHVIQVLQILRREVSYSSEFKPLLFSCFRASAKPIFESKAYECLNYAGLIASYLQELASFWSLDDIEIKIHVTRCFSCIINGGKDVSAANTDTNTIHTHPSNSRPIEDKAFLQEVIRNCGILETIVHEFFACTDIYQEEVSLSRSQSMRPLQQSSDDAEDPAEESVDFERSTERIVQAETLCGVMLTMCLDLSRTVDNAAVLNDHQISNCVLTLLGSLIKLGFSDKKIHDIVELLWNCLEVYLKYTLSSGAASVANDIDIYTVKSIIDIESATIILKEVLVQLLHKGYRQTDKEMRNNILILLTITSKFPESRLAMIRAGILPTLITFACVAESGPDAWDHFHAPLVFRNFASTSDVDLELKRILWLLIGDLLRCRDQHTYHLVSSSPFIGTLLLYIDQDSFDHDSVREKPAATSSSQDNDNNSSFGDLSAPSSMQTTSMPKPSTTKTYFSSLSRTQLRELQVVASALLSDHAAHCLETFMSDLGPSRILAVVNTYSHSKLSEHKSLVYYSILILINISVHSLRAKAYIVEASALDKLTLLFGGNDDEASRSLSARLIAILCDGNAHGQGLFRELSGIKELVSAVAKYAEVRKPCVGNRAGIKLLDGEDAWVEDPLSALPGGDVSVFMVSVLGCIRATVLRLNANEKHFAQEEGIDALLDMLEVSPFLFQLQILRVLSDLSENYALAPFFKGWRSAKTMRYAAQVLVHCWMDEEIRLGVQREEGTFQNLLDPLGSQKWAVLEAAAPAGEDDSTAPRSYVSSRLTKAVLHSRLGDSAPGGVPMSYREELLENDLRCTIANIITRLYSSDPLFNDLTIEDGSSAEFKIDNEMSVAVSTSLSVSAPSDTVVAPTVYKQTTYPYGLNATDLQVISICWQYTNLREYQAWETIRKELVDERVTLIDADNNMIESTREEFFRITRTIQEQQMQLKNIDNLSKLEQSEHFTAKIIAQKNAQIKSEWIKRNAKLVRTVPKHHAKASSSASHAAY